MVLSVHSIGHDDLGRYLRHDEVREQHFLLSSWLPQGATCLA